MLLGLGAPGLFLRRLEAVRRGRVRRRAGVVAGALAAAGLSVVSQADKDNYAKMATYAEATTQDTSDAMYEMLKTLETKCSGLTLMQLLKFFR